MAYDPIDLSLNALLPVLKLKDRLMRPLLINVTPGFLALRETINPDYANASLFEGRTRKDKQLRGVEWSHQSMATGACAVLWAPHRLPSEASRRPACLPTPFDVESLQSGVNLPSLII